MNSLGWFLIAIAPPCQPPPSVFSCRTAFPAGCIGSVTAAYDVIIAGLGAMGSAAAFHLARRGRKVLGIDRFHPPHALGSSHGESRIIREAYFEHPCYVPLVRRAYELWTELEQHSTERLYLQTGGIMLGPADGPLVTGARPSAETHKLQYELLTAQEVHSRFPAISPQPEMVAVAEPRAGVLFPERCLRTHLSAATTLGAEFRFNETVHQWRDIGSEVEVLTTNGIFRAPQLLISAGSWVRELVPGLPVIVERQSLVWFKPQKPLLFQPDRCPIYICEYEPGRFFYGFPDLGNGVKVALHHQGDKADPNTASRDVSRAEMDSLHAVVNRFLPELSNTVLNATSCLYTNMPDENFLIDWFPSAPRVLVCSPCSGHGFTFSSVVGEIAADLLIKRESPFDLALFRWR